MRRWGLVVALVTGLANASCAGGATNAKTRNVSLMSAESRGAREAGPITETELQQQLQRFAGVFFDRISQATTELSQSSPPAASSAALNNGLIYASSALDIATGPLPEINLLDMLVFVRLCREVFSSYWMPKVFGERGRVVLDVFQTSEDELWRIAARVMSADQRARLVTLVEQWRQDNPNLFRVEGVRLMDFSQRAGKVEQERAQEAGGLLSSVKGATQAADQAVLLAERGMFLAQRMPFLLRMQARVGSREILGDALSRFGSPAQLAAEVRGLEPMIRELPTVAEQSHEAAHEARLLARDIKPLIPSAEGAEKINETLANATELTQSTRQLLQDVRELVPAERNGTLEAAQRGVDRLMRRVVLYLALLGASLSVMWWGGYYLVKRRLAERASPA